MDMLTSRRRHGYSARSLNIAGKDLTDTFHCLSDSNTTNDSDLEINSYFLLETSDRTQLIGVADAKWWGYELLENHFYLGLLMVATIFTRVFRIGLVNVPVWDEFGSHYHLRTFYHDVHPPLGKLLVALGGLLAGYDGSFDFKHSEFPPNVNYTCMRLFHALFGIGLVPLAYFTCDQLGLSRRVSLASASLILFDNAITLLSRFIILDAILLFFNACSVYFLVAFHGSRARPFTQKWYMTLLGLGISLGLVVSVKWIGLFVIGLVGLYTLEDLWARLSEVDFFKHLVARIFCLILVPVTIYLATFWLHFAILHKPGTGDGVMPSLFQARLKDSPLSLCHSELMFMSKVTLRSASLFGALLHSSNNTYPQTQGRQVSTYDHIHPDNDWIVWLPTFQNANSFLAREFPQGLQSTPSAIKVHDGDIIRLSHAATGRRLRLDVSRDAYISGPSAFPVSCEDGESIYDDWRIEILEDIPRNSSVVQTLVSRFQLRDPITGCLLASGYNKYPAWGFLQNEVYCTKDPTSRTADTLWNIEFLNSPQEFPPPQRTFPRHFFRDFLVVNLAMWNINRILLPDNDKYDHLSSQPWEWPLMRRGIRATAWTDSSVKYFILGNPLVWWGTTFGLLAYSVLFLCYRLRMQCNIREWQQVEWRQFTLVGKVFIGGWFMHYLPFFFIDRVLYLHHYLPALYFLCIVTPFTLEHLLKLLNLSKKSLDHAFLTTFFSLVMTFLYFSPLTFGTTAPSHQLASKAWLTTWHLTGQESS
ncbi:Protein O-mannosyltransferase 2 [Entomophthora muscae]|uniref:Protein O-mannosyltransferase 2 n=1 Tax=Entomophthora muscae TaxID=34485 RepID=A0ACC2RU36_9FUNG|nr:Protein O-mannosyltransferase 2 [Entomophthora muscae]